MVRLTAMLGALLVAAGPAAGDPRFGAPAVTRLWVQNAQERVPACSAMYVRDPEDRLPRGRVWVVTAGHCAAGSAWIGRDGPEERFQTLRRPAVADVAIARTFGREGEATAYRLADRMPREGTVWIHGFPFGAEHITAARVRGESAARPGSVELTVGLGPVTEAGPGFSGAPVLDAQGEVVGMVWGLRQEDVRTLAAFVTPAETLRALLRDMEVGR